MTVEIHPAHKEREQKTSLLAVIGETLRSERNERGLTLRQVAEGAHVSVSYLAEIERGEKDPSSRVLESIAGGLGMETSDLLIRVALALEPEVPVRPVAESLAA
jgi:transcriptional regulator with XRE-family HTH domain